MSVNSEKSEKEKAENQEIKPEPAPAKDEKPSFVDINKVAEPEKPKESVPPAKEIKEISIKSETKPQNSEKRQEPKKKGALFWAGVSIGVIGTVFAVTYLVMKIRKAMAEAKTENAEIQQGEISSTDVFDMDEPIENNDISSASEDNN